MDEQFYLADRNAVEDATALLAVHGPFAVVEASARANASRDRGNVIHFCRWRQVARLVMLLGGNEAVGTVH